MDGAGVANSESAQRVLFFPKYTPRRQMFKAERETVNFDFSQKFCYNIYIKERERQTFLEN